MPTQYQIPGQKSSSGNHQNTWKIRLLGFGAILILLITLIATTQYLAWYVGRNQLPGAVTTIRDIRIYPPWYFITWFWQIKRTYNTALYVPARPAGIIFMVGMGLSSTCIFLAVYMKNMYSTLHGSARFAEHKDLQQAGLLADKGVYVGGWMKGDKQLYLRHDGKEHILALAPTRSGKGVGLVIPTLVGWDHSAVVLDIKGENWALTSGWRQKQGQSVMRWDPTDTTPGRSARYNPLAEIRLKTKDEVADVQNVATLLVDPNGKGVETFWDIEATNLLTGAILHVLYREALNGRTGTLAEVLYELSKPGYELKEIMSKWQETKHLTEDDPYKFIDAQGQETESRCHPVVKMVAAGILAAPDETAGSIVKTATSKLDLYKDPIVAKNTAVSDFCIRDLMDADNPVSLYLILNPRDIARLRPLVRIFLTQLLFSLMPEMEFVGGSMKAPYKHRLLLLLDEFPALGKLGIFEQALAYMGGWNIKCYLICQDMDQLTGAYGRDETITSNCHVVVAYAPNKVPTAEYLSKRTGVMTVVSVNESTSYQGSGMFAKKSTSKSIQETQRPVMTVDEVMTLPGATKVGEAIISPGDMLIYAAGFRPAYGKQILFFLDPYMSTATKVPAPEASDRIENHKGKPMKC